MKDSMSLPQSARGEPPRARDRAGERSPARAYIKNPVAGQEMLTPEGALRAIGILAAMLEADSSYRTELEAREAPR